MPARRRIPPLAIAFVLSLALHVLLVGPLVSALAEPSVVRVEQAVAPSDDEMPPAPRPPVQPGIAEPTPARLNWIGYRDYQEHLARLAEIEQAALTTEPVGAPAPPDAATRREDGNASADAPRADAAEPSPSPLEPSGAPTDEPLDTSTRAPQITEAPADTTVDPAESTEPAASIADEPVDPTRPQIPFATPAELVEAWTAAGGPSPNVPAAPPTDDPQAADAVGESAQIDDPSPAAPQITADAADLLAQLLARWRATFASPDMHQRPARATDAQRVDPPSPAREAEDDNAPDAPAPAAAASPGRPIDAEQADAETDAFAVIDVPLTDLNPGRPVAAQGVELKPRRPQFTILQHVTTAPGNPVVEIAFGRDGRPKHAAVQRSSGIASIDRTIESSLYAWRAEGEEIEALDDDATLRFIIRIILNPRVK